MAVLAEVYGDLLRAAGATERLMELLAARSPIAAPARPRAAAADARRLDGRAATTSRFHYPSRPQHAGAARLRACEVAPGETVALVGPSGAGKSTVFQLLLRFYDAERRQRRGRRRAGARGRACTRCAQRIGIVPQDSVIFSANAMENIRYGRPEASDDEVIAAAQRRVRARLHRARCPRATAPSSASAACACRAASASASRSRARC